MPRHIEAYMDGVALSSVGPVIIQQVYEDAPTLEIMEGERPGRYGTRMINKKRQSLKVTIEMAIRELFDLQARASIMESVAAWARGSILELSNRPARRLSVVCTGVPTLGAVRDYTATARIELTAYEIPYWEDKLNSTLSLTGTSTSGSLTVPGTVPSPVCLDVVPSATLTSFSVTVGDETIALTGLSVAANGHLLFARDERDDLKITYNGVSQLSKRSAASADDLMPSPGSVTVSITADKSVSVGVSARGRWE